MLMFASISELSYGTYSSTVLRFPITLALYASTSAASTALYSSVGWETRASTDVISSGSSGTF